MGGDKGPGEILKGCWEAAPLLDGHDQAIDQVILVGDQQIIRPALEASGLTPEQKKHYSVVHTTQVVAMDESPVLATKTKPDSSISVICKLVSKGEADVAISAGNTGAFAAASQLRMRNLTGISRPGISVTVPTPAGPVVLCDVGANVAPKPKNLLDYAIMAGIYCTAVLGKPNPKIGLLSVGEEDAKGSTVIKDAHKLLRDEPLVNFFGNVEGRDLTRGTVDVIVTDGFVGNVVLKLMEGVTEGLFKQVARELQTNAPQAMEFFKPTMKKLAAIYDWQEYGGAPLLGVQGYSIICHGRSESRAIKNAIRVGKQLFNSGVNQTIVEQIEKSIPVAEESEDRR
jgi:glycerol-3-phosphate acyltransferase PlsX